jgi:hypothetical protein
MAANRSSGPVDSAVRYFWLVHVLAITHYISAELYGTNGSLCTTTILVFKNLFFPGAQCRDSIMQPLLKRERTENDTGRACLHSTAESAGQQLSPCFFLNCASTVLVPF